MLNGLAQQGHSPLTLEDESEMKTHLRKSKPVTNQLLTPEQLLQLYHGAKRLEKLMKRDRWKLAAAANADRRLIIGNCHIFKPPGKE